METTPIDAHCHLFSAKYGIEEAAAIGWAYVTGNYPREEPAVKAVRAAMEEYSWKELLEVVMWFRDLGAAFSDYETNYERLKDACREGLDLPAADELIVVPLMIDIFYMFAPPTSIPPAAIKAPARQVRRGARADRDSEASTEAYERFKEQIMHLAEGGAATKAAGRRAGGRGSLRAGAPTGITARDIEQIFRHMEAVAPERRAFKGMPAGIEISPGFRHEIESLLDLQENHAGSVFPFFAVDPRRPGAVQMAIEGIPEFNGGRPLVTPRGPFFGIKLYTRLGYLPADVPDELYLYCLEHDLPIIVHASDGGFPPGKNWRYRDYAEPKHWEAVLNRDSEHRLLRLDLAHLGNGNAAWPGEILRLMNGYPNVYADLACYTSPEDRAQAKKIWNTGGATIKERLFFGTDFVASALTEVASLEGYFKEFRKTFGTDDLKILMMDNTRRFLAPILPGEERVIRPAVVRPAIPVTPPREEKHGRKLGWLPDLPDYRDLSVETDYAPRHLVRLNRTETVKGMLSRIHGHPASALPKTAASGLSASVDLRPWCSPVEDQGDIGACTAHAAAALIEYYERRAFGSYLDVSRLFLYKATRNLLNWTGDTGAYLRTTMEAMVLFGVPPEQYFPYDPADVDLEPSAFCYSFAQNYQTLSYFRLDSPRTTRKDLLTLVKANLAKGVPAMFGFTVFSSVNSAARTGMIPFPIRTDRREGGHAVAAVGYDDNLVISHPYTAESESTTGAILIRNSWGTDWGEKGYGWLPYKYVLENLAIDWWTVLKQEWVDTNQFREMV